MSTTATYKKMITKGYASAIENTPVENDTIRLTIDTFQLFADVNEERIEITDFIKGLTEEEIRSTFAPLPKFYFSSDTRKLLVYDVETDEWIICAEANSDTAKKALEADKALEAENANHALSADTATNAGTATYAENASTATYANNAENANHATSADTATNASTAEYVTNAGSATYAENAENANHANTSDNATNASTAEYASNASTAEYANNAENANHAASADTATNASTAEYATNAENANHTVSADSATNASTAEYASNAGTATYAENANNAESAENATNASTAEYAINAENANNAVSADSATNASTAEYASNASKSLNDANGEQINTFYAPLSSPMFTGNPTVPTPSTGSKDSQIANTEFVMNAIIENLGSGGGGPLFNKVDSFDNLPETGTSNIIYLVPNSESGENNYYDEYIWINDSYEIIGSTQIDLSGYYKEIEVSGTGNAITGVVETENGLQFEKGASFLTEHPSVSKNSSTATETPSAGQSIEMVDSVTVDSYGHLVAYRKKTVTLPDSVSNASTAIYATNAGTATYATNASTATYATDAGSATNASTATYATNAGTASIATNDSAGNNINTTYIKNVTVSGRTVTFTRGDGSTFSITTQDNNTTYANYKGATTAAAGTAGLVPAATTATRTRFLRGDGTWQVPSNTTYANYKGATTAAAGTAGLVPAATTATRTQFLRGDGAWATPTNTTYGVASTAANGLCPKRSGTTHTYLRGDGTWKSINVVPAGESDLDFGDLDG